jgi:ABC-2 type transport system ATP-binding protein
MWQIVRDLVAGGVTIFLTTQHLEEADQLADRIAVLNNGKLVAEGTADELKRRIPGSYIRLKFTGEAELAAAERLLGTGTREPKDLALKIPSDGKVGTVRTLLDRLDDAAIDADELTIITPDLDDVFLALTDPSTMAKDSVR